MGGGSVERSWLSIVDLPLPAVTAWKFSQPHHHLRVRANRMRGVRIVEHDGNKGCKTTFQFMTSSEKSARETAETEVRYLALTVLDCQAQHPLR